MYLTKIFETVYEKYFIEVEKKYPNANIKETLKNYIKERFERLFEDTNETKVEKTYKICLESCDSEFKRPFYSIIKDEIDYSYEKLCPDYKSWELEDISRIPYGLGMKKVAGKEITAEEIKEAEDTLKKMEALVPEIRDYNQRLAEMFIQQVKWEIEYIKGNSEVMSPRMGEQVRFCKRYGREITP